MRFDSIAMRARLSPQRQAIWAGRWYDYAELEQRAARLAAALRSANIKAGDRVALMAENELLHFDLMHASAKLGCIAVPFNYRLAASEQAALLQQIEPGLLIHAGDRPGWAGALDCWTLEEAQARMVATEPLALQDCHASGAEDLALILFTGGSTGRPKGACISHRQQYANALNTIVGWGLREDDAVIQATPCFHAAVNALATPLLHLGARVILQRRFSAEGFLQLMQEHGPSLLFMVPTMYQMLAEAPGFAQADFSRVRWAISGGAPCPEPVREAFAARGVHFKQGYGMTEAGVNCFTMTVDEAATRPEAVGKPMPYAEAVIRDPDGREVATGQVGELTLRGPHLFSGYFRQPEATAEVLREGWLWTGDLASQDAEGFVSIRGRRKEMYISGGENVYPTEVEAAIYAEPEVAACAVIAVPDSRWGERGIAVVVPMPGSRIDADELRQRMHQRLAGYKCPREYVFVPALPTTAAGKIDKPALRRDYLTKECA